MLTSLLAFVGGALLVGWLVFGRKQIPAVAPQGNPLAVAGRNDLFGDAINDTLVVQPVLGLSRAAVATDAKALAISVETEGGVVTSDHEPVAVGEFS